MMLNRLKEIVEELEAQMMCTCEYGSWQPRKLSGHTQACQIHKAALAKHARELKKELRE